MLPRPVPLLALLAGLAAALSGCATLQSPSEPAIPSSKAPRQPINQIGEPQALRERLSGPAQASRVRRGGIDDFPAPDETRFPVTTRYVFGVSDPVIVCAVSHVCDVELQAGERIAIAPRIGDKGRWGVDLITAGQAGHETPHLTVMPLQAGAETSLVVVTNRRTYHLFLRASRTASMLHTVFTYPEDLNARWKALGASTQGIQAVMPSGEAAP